MHSELLECAYHIWLRCDVRRVVQTFHVEHDIPIFYARAFTTDQAGNIRVSETVVHACHMYCTLSAHGV